MSATKFTTPYQKVTKENGQPLDAADWNNLSEAAHNAQAKINEVIDDIANIPTGGGSSSGGGGTTPSGVISVSSKGNTTLSATKHINIEPAYVPDGGSGTYGDVQIKPGDDITLESHHRASDKRDEITIKTSDGVDGSKAPVKLQVIASNMTLSTKGKVVSAGSNDTPEVMNVNVTTGNGKAYLKVRARAIDLRCEEHGGIALQPKGADSDGHMNKIKFEHGGGDGLEFGTFNAEKTSIFTDEYRFNREGIWKMATRHTETSDKIDENDDTTANKYVKPTDDNISELVDDPSNYEEPDDFYDLINVADEQCTTRDIIRTAFAFNGAKGIHSKITDKGNLEIETSELLEVVSSETATTVQSIGPYNVMWTPQSVGLKFDLETFLSVFSDEVRNEVNAALAAMSVGDVIEVEYNIYTHTSNTSASVKYKKVAPSINIESAAGIKLKGVLDFGSTFGFGETDNGIEFLYKKTKKNAEKKCDMLKVVATNNSANAYTVNSIDPVEDPDDANGDGYFYAETPTTLQPGESRVIASVSVYDICKLVSYFKNNEQGPWSNQ